tara:strand:+ start:2451 stop:2720 length:270 start_codon:yes stop_codon:yes gene_type:complete
MSKTAQRIGDIDPRITLRLVTTDDGDIIISIKDERGVITRELEPGALEECAAEVEFTDSGGMSHKTLMALHALFAAMEVDNKEYPQHPR